MRSDMPKLLVERPRGGWRGRKSRPHLRAIRDLDSLPERVSIGRDNLRTKWLSENLAPLVRFLDRRVGRPWDQVYSEIRAHVRFEDPIQLHVLQHLWHFVERHVDMIDGWPHERPSGRRLSSYRRSFYICPVTGLLRRIPSEPRPRWGMDGPRPRTRERKRKRNGSRR